MNDYPIRSTGIVLLALCVMGGAYTYVLHMQRAQQAHTQTNEPITPAPQITNPASLHCTEVGGTLSIQKNRSGAEYGLCMFEENRACEEWALFRGECPVGGRKTTGYDTIEQKYCAWLGGSTRAEPNAQCALPNGTVCSAADVYAGTCQ